MCLHSVGAGSSLHHKCNSAKHRIISPKGDPRTGGTYSSTHSEVQNNDVSEGKTEHSHGGGKNGRAGADGAGGTGGREKRNGKVHKPALLHQNSMEVSSSNEVEVPDTTQSSPVSISSGLNSWPRYSRQSRGDRNGPRSLGNEQPVSAHHCIHVRGLWRPCL